MKRGRCIELDLGPDAPPGTTCRVRVHGDLDPAAREALAVIMCAAARRMAEEERARAVPHVVDGGFCLEVSDDG